jgi:hypothetical protein
MAEQASALAGASLKCSTGAFLFGRPCHPGIELVVARTMLFQFYKNYCSNNSGANLRKKAIRYSTGAFIALST